MKRCPVRRTEPAHAGEHVTETVVELREQDAETVRHENEVVALKEPPAPDRLRDNYGYHPREGPSVRQRGQSYLILAPLLAPITGQVFENSGPYWI